MSRFALNPPPTSPGHALSATLAPLASNGGIPAEDEVVEISLLLPAAWTRQLLELAGQRRQSVGQLLRSMIEQSLPCRSPDP